MDKAVLDDIAQIEFGMDFDQLGPNEKEWCIVEYENFLLSRSVEY